MIRCRRCGRRLVDPESIKRELGAECLFKNPTPRSRMIHALEEAKAKGEPDQRQHVDKILARIAEGARLTPRMKRYVQQLQSKRGGQAAMLSNVSPDMQTSADSMHPETPTKETTPE